MASSRRLGAQLVETNLFLVRPDHGSTGEPSDQPVKRGVEFVGVVVRGPARGGKSGAMQTSGDPFRWGPADLESLIDGPFIATEISPMINTGRAFDLKAAPDTDFSELLTRVRNHLFHDPDAVARALAVPQQHSGTASGDDVAGDTIALPVTLLDRLIETLGTQLSLLMQLKGVQTGSFHEQVTLETPTGPMQYTLPLSLNDTYSSTEASEILSPTGKGHRTIAQNRRRANELLGLKIGSRFRYPRFQIDPTKHEIRPVVAYANRQLECDADPWGTLDWWFSKDEGLDGSRPIDLLQQDELTEEAIDFAIERARQGMD
jgi:hypothetical protein